MGWTTEHVDHLASCSDRHVDREFQCGVFVGLEGRVLEGERATLWVVQQLPSRPARPHLVCLPPCLELRASLLQPVEKVRERWVSRPEVVGRPKLRSHALRLLRPCFAEQRACPRIGEDE